MYMPLPVWASWIATYRGLGAYIISPHNFRAVDIHCFQPTFLVSHRMMLKKIPEAGNFLTGSQLQGLGFLRMLLEHLCSAQAI